MLSQSMADAKATAFGVFVTLILSCTMVVAGLKAGITPGVSPLVVLCGWGAFQGSARGLAGARFLNLAQVAGSGGMAVVSGVIFAEPMLQVLRLNIAQAALLDLNIAGDLRKMPWPDAQALMRDNGLSVSPVDVPTTILACLAGSLIGWGFVGLAMRKILSDPTLPAPEARACTSMIEAAVSEASKRPHLGPSLVLSIFGSFALRVMAAIGLAKDHIVIWSTSIAERSFAVALPLDSAPLYLGIGALLTVPTAMLTFVGAFLRLIGDYLLFQVDPSWPLAERYPANSMRWVGGGAMTVGVVYSLLKFAGLGSRSRNSTSSDVDDSLLGIGKRNARLFIVSITVGMAIVAVWLLVDSGFTFFAWLMLFAVLVMAALMVPLGAILSLQIGSSSSPISGTVFVTALVLCLVATATNHRSIDHVPTIANLLVVGCVAACTANDSSQDYKTLQLCGLPPRDGFLAQFLGLMVGSVTVPVSLYISDRAFGLGTERLPAPQGQMFATLVEGLLLEQNLPWYPILIGVSIGVFAVVVDRIGSRCGLQLPAMAMAVGIYLSPDTGVGILIGSIFRHVGERLSAQRRGSKELEHTNECILASAGMITGTAFLDLVLGVAVLCGFGPDSLVLISNKAEGDASVPAIVSNTVSVIGVVFLGSILFYNSLHGFRADEQEASTSKDDAPDHKHKVTTGVDIGVVLEASTSKDDDPDDDKFTTAVGIVVEL